MGYWTITLKRIVIGSVFNFQHALYQFKPEVLVFVAGGGVNKQFNHHVTDPNSPSDTVASEVRTINKSFEVGPVKKKQSDILIEVRSNRVLALIREQEFKMEGNIYELWKNGYTPKHPEYFVDVFFSWRLQPKPENKEN